MRGIAIDPKAAHFDAIECCRLSIVVVHSEMFGDLAERPPFRCVGIRAG